MSKILNFYRRSDQYKELFREEQPFKVYGVNDLHKIPQIHLLSDKQQFSMRVVANVLPFRVNQYVIDELID